MAARKRTPEQAEKQAAYMRLWNETNKQHKSEYMRQRYLSRREEFLGKVRAFRLANAERIREQKRLDHAKNKEKNNAKAREYHRLNKEVQNAKNREYQRENWEAVRQAAREWRIANKERTSEYMRQLYLAKPEQFLANNRNRKARVKAAPGKHTAADVARLFDVQRGICSGCNAPLIKTGKGRFHVDHVHPIKLGGSNDPSNLQLLCPFCNMSKGRMHPDDWARSRGRLFA
jgi:5-methylcytosine-specific restriction endonuclease McrA